VFHIDNAPEGLEEDLALEVACKSLILEGLEPSKWRPVECVETPMQGPSGKDDRFLARNSINTNCGYIVFFTEDYRHRAVSVELADSVITGEVNRGK
jgi:hypothetical protein